MARRARLHARERTMRELVAQYLSHSISRRGFVGGLTKAGLTATAAQSVLSAATSVTYAQGAGPPPASAAAAPAAPAAGAASARSRWGEAVPGLRRRRLRRAVDRLRREIRLRQFRQRGRPVLRGA